MDSTMQDFPLTLAHVLRHGARVHRHSEVLTYTGPGQDVRAASFGEVAERVARLAGALNTLGIGPDDRVGTFMWNTQEHLEAYFAIPCRGAVLHTLNLRLPANQLIHIVNSAQDKVILVHASVVPILAKVAEQFTTVEHYVVVDDTGAADAGILAELGQVHYYEELLAKATPVQEWPELEERQAGSMNFTSGTTGDPKGVVYSHRSMFLHALGILNAGVIPLTDRDRVMVVVPMFHVNAWGMPYSAWMAGADIIMPARFLQGGPLSAVIEATRPTFSSGVPSIWNDLLHYVQANPGVDISSLHTLTAGGSAVAVSLIEAFDRLGIRMLQGWGMTETSPVCALSNPPRIADPDDDVAWRARAGRVVPGVELRIVTAAGEEAPWDGETVGEIEVRGPWITGSYFGDPTPEKFHDGWLRTGDVGHLDDYGYVTITDRVKDVIKSGGEWISSVDLENTLMGHPQIREASVVGVPDERWGERPLALIVRADGSAASAVELRDWVAERVARWWIPERWSFIDEVPKTSVGKFDKKLLRQRYAEGSLPVETT